MARSINCAAKFQPSVSLLQARALAGVARLQELAHEIGGVHEAHESLLLRGLDAERNSQMRLAGPGPADDRDDGRTRVGAAEPAEGVVLLLDGFGDPVVPVPIELTGSVPGN